MKQTPSPIRVIIADDHTVFRQGLRMLLAAERDIDVVGEAANGYMAVDLVRKLCPDVVVMDVAMPQMNGLEGARQIRASFPDVKILVLSAHGDDAYVEGVSALGVEGYLVKQTTAHFLAEAIRKVRSGGTFYSPVITRRLQRWRQNTCGRKGVSKAKADILSPREREVLQRIAEGEANKQIAAILAISIKTVEKHRAHLMEKLDIHDTAGLTRYAIRSGAVECSFQFSVE